MVRADRSQVVLHAPGLRVLLHARQRPRRAHLLCCGAPASGFRIERLKDKMGGRCLASSEVEFSALPARILGEEGRGVATMATQINYTRLDTMLGVAGML